MPELPEEWAESMATAAFVPPYSRDRIPAKHPSPSPLPTGADLENVKRFMKLKLTSREEQ